MSRGIQYKVWDKENSKWYEPTFESYKGKLEHLVLNPDGSLSMITINGKIHESMFPDRFEVCEYARTMDDYSKEMYEGSILEVHGNKLQRYVIRFVDRSFVAASNYDNAIFSYIALSDLMDSDDEKIIIGTIFENPELLERPND